MEGVHGYTNLGAIKLTVVIIVGYRCYQLHTQLYPISSQG
jgi:hypothetical protein